MAVRGRHSQPCNRVRLEVDFDQNRWFIADDPPIVAGLDGDGRRGSELLHAAVRILDVNLATHEESDMRVLAAVGLGDRFHVGGPAEARLVDDALDPRIAGANRVHLRAAYFATLSASNRSQQYIRHNALPVIVTLHSEVLHGGSSRQFSTAVPTMVLPDGSPDGSTKVLAPVLGASPTRRHRPAVEAP
jgi:hypothetical protein